LYIIDTCFLINIVTGGGSWLKCIRDRNGVISIVSDSFAWKKVARDNYTYCTKAQLEKAKEIVGNIYKEE